MRVDERLKIEIVSRQVHDEPFWRYLVEIEWNFQGQPKVSKKEITGKEFWEWVKTGGNLKKDESQNILEADREQEVILKFSGICIGETESLSCSSEGITKVHSGCGMFYRTSKKVGEIVEHMGKKYRVLENSFYSPPDYEVETSDKHTLTLVEI